MIRALLLVAAAGLSVGAGRDPLAGLVAGAPVDCIGPSQGLSPTIVDTTTILYREGGRRVWRTGPTGTCPALRPDQILIVDLFAGRICRNDRFRVLSPNTSIPSGACRFTAFTPYDRH